MSDTRQTAVPDTPEARAQRVADFEKEIADSQLQTQKGHAARIAAHLERQEQQGQWLTEQIERIQANQQRLTDLIQQPSRQRFNVVLGSIALTFIIAFMGLKIAGIFGWL